MKIPKLMVKTILTKFHFYRSPRAEHGNQFPWKVGNSKSLGMKYEVHIDSDNILEKKDSQNGKEWDSTAEHESQPIVGPLYQLLNLEVKDTLEGKNNRKDKRPLTLSSFTDQKRGWSFFKTNYCSEAAEDSTDVPSWKVLGIKVRSCRLVRVVSRIQSITRSMKKKVRKQTEYDRNREEDEEEQLCLCKKRILMGARCKPLHFSGALQYDTDGLLMPGIAV